MIAAATPIVWLVRPVGTPSLVLAPPRRHWWQRTPKQ